MTIALGFQPFGSRLQSCWWGGLLVVCVATFAAGCAVNPVSGRTEMAVLSAEQERELGAEEAKKVEASMGLVAEPALVAYVQADDVGVELAARAGYDPKELPRILHTLEREDALRRNGPPRKSFFDTHPATPERVQETQARAARLQPGAGTPVAPPQAFPKAIAVHPKDGDTGNVHGGTQ